MQRLGLVVVVWWALVQTLYATSETPGLQLTPIENKQGILLGYSRNYPQLNSKKKYGPSIYHPIVGIRHFSENWVLGLSVHFKFLKDRKDDSKVAIWTLEDEISYRFRLYHPVYMLSGIKFLYLFPVQAGKYPLRRRSNSSLEIGVGATFSILYFLKPKTAFGIFADLWRGTGSRSLGGIEAGIHFMFPLDF